MPSIQTDRQACIHACIMHTLHTSTHVNIIRHPNLIFGPPPPNGPIIQHVAVASCGETVSEVKWFWTPNFRHNLKLSAALSIPQFLTTWFPTWTHGYWWYLPFTFVLICTHVGDMWMYVLMYVCNALLCYVMLCYFMLCMVMCDNVI